MPQFRYVGEDERVYLGAPTRQVRPGDVIDADENPDPHRFETVAEPAPKGKPPPRPPSQED
uniref:hypothetical protein n=1 Tax=Pseudonocardia sp. CA-138482 TaxID=3240023 RepID=UPI003F49A39C